MNRYQRFKHILTEAANCKINYQGHGLFWNTLSLKDLQEVSIYGIRMIADKNDFDKQWQRKSSGSSSTTRQAAKTAPPKSSCCGSSKMINAPAKKSSCGESDKKEKSSTEPSSCCGTDKKETTSKASYPGRGAASNLVIGLKGEYPFDGSHFGRLPFGGKPVSAENIQFIEQWIDDGCPDCEEEQPKPDESEMVEMGKIAHPPLPASNQYLHDNGGLKQRRNAQYLENHEVLKLRYAIQQVKNLNSKPLDTRSFNSWAKIHGDSCQHGWEQFLPWHRAFLYEFELNLQEFVPDVTLPYWDWTMDNYNQGVVPQGKYSGLIPSLYACWVTDKNLTNLEANDKFDQSFLPVLRKMTNKLYGSGIELVWVAEDNNNGKKMSMESQNILMPELAINNPLWHRNRFPGMFYQVDDNHNPIYNSKGRRVLANGHDQGSLANVFHHHYPTKEEINDILALNNWKDFGGGHYANQSFGMLSQNPHNTGHIWSGGENPLWKKPEPRSSKTNPQFGDMFDDLIAFFDPIAWGHHSNVDRLWDKWQNMHPNTNPDDPTAVMMPWSYTTQELLDIHKLGYEYVKGSKVYQVNNQTPITKLRTEDTGLHQDVLNDHSKVEIRLHDLHRPVDSHYIRIFLNSPDADHLTPLVDNDHYVGYMARFGHGDCIGGPGHCDIPAKTRHKFDLRPRHHNTPTTHRFDATEQVKKLLAKGHKDIHVNAVVIGPNGHLAQGKSRAVLNAVSINFME